MFERSPDVIDAGSNLAEAERASLTAAQRRAAKPKQVRNPDGSWPDPDCVECGNPIGEERLEAVGAIHCIECATTMEKGAKQYAKR